MKKMLLMTLAVLLGAMMLSLASCKSKTVSHEIIFEVNGGALEEGVIGNYEEGRARELPTPSKDGYRFIGWYLSADFSGNAISVIKPYEPMTLYAKYEKIYKITYVTGGGEANNPTEIAASDTVVLKDAIREQEFFAGWYSDNEFTNRVYKISDADSDIVLYAKYYTKYKIIYDLDGVQDTDNPLYYASELGAHLYGAQKPGYVLAGWENQNGENLGFTIPVGTSGDIYLKAIWEIATYSIRWETSGIAVANAPTSYRYTEGVSEDKFPTVTGNGKIFLYWYRIVDGVEEKITSIPATEYGDIVIYAKWYGEQHLISSIWHRTVNDTYDTNTYIQKEGNAEIITVPEALKEYANNGRLRVRITATFTTKVRSMGNATATAKAFFTVDGQEHLVSTVSAKGGGYLPGNVLGTFPQDGQLMSNQNSVTVSVALESASDTVSLDCKYHMESDKKSSTVKTDLYYLCDSIVYEFYVE